MVKARNEADLSMENEIMGDEGQQGEREIVNAELKAAEDKGMIPPKVRLGQPLPDKYHNPPCGQEGHFCLRKQDECYDPTWTQLFIERRDDSDADPIIFPNPCSWPCSVPRN